MSNYLKFKFQQPLSIYYIKSFQLIKFIFIKSMEKYSNDTNQKINCRQCGLQLDSQLFKRKALSSGNQSTIYFKRAPKDFVFKPKSCIPFLNKLKTGQNFQVHAGDKIIRWFQVTKGSCYCMTCFFQTKNYSSFQKGSISVICQKMLNQGKQPNNSKPISQKVQVNSTQTSQKYRCPKCKVWRLDNHRYGNVYMCRLCQQNWGQRPVIVHSENGATKVVHQSKQSQYFKNPQQYRCPKCSCLRADNHRYGNVYMCRQCQENWGQRPVIVSSKNYQPTKVVYQSPSYVANNSHSLSYTPYKVPKVQEDISVYYNQHKFCPRCKTNNIRQNANLYSVFNCNQCGQSWHTDVVSYGVNRANFNQDDYYGDDDYYDDDDEDENYYYGNRR